MGFLSLPVEQEMAGPTGGRSCFGWRGRNNRVVSSDAGAEGLAERRSFLISCMRWGRKRVVPSDAGAEGLSLHATPQGLPPALVAIAQAEDTAVHATPQGLPPALVAEGTAPIPTALGQAEEIIAHSIPHRSIPPAPPIPEDGVHDYMRRFNPRKDLEIPPRPPRLPHWGEFHRRQARRRRQESESEAFVARMRREDKLHRFMHELWYNLSLERKGPIRSSGA